jgi:hypothetical protein
MRHSLAARALFLELIINSICDLLGKLQQLRHKAQTERMDQWVMSWKGCGRKRSSPNVRYCRSICLGRLGKTTQKKNLVTMVASSPRYEFRAFRIRSTGVPPSRKVYR